MIYGAVLPENGNFTDPHNHYTLTGKEFDENTGLVWFGSRHYEPETGVWMGQDSYRGRLSSPGSLHRFGYVGNNPTNNTDFYGYFPFFFFVNPISYPMPYSEDEYVEPDTPKTPPEEEFPDPESNLNVDEIDKLSIEESVKRQLRLTYMKDCVINQVVNDFHYVLNEGKIVKDINGNVIDRIPGMNLGVSDQIWQDLLLATAAHESHFFSTNRKQKSSKNPSGFGTGRGLFQMEIDTAADMWDAYFPIADFRGGMIKDNYLDGGEPSETALEKNDKYGAAMALNKYIRKMTHQVDNNFAGLEKISKHDRTSDEYIEGLFEFWYKYYYAGNEDKEGRKKLFLEGWDTYVLKPEEELAR
ncbi:RHS repeat-associated core domain-containing protein [Desulfobulbus sp. N3]|nr:RHS repeat-associated core domain-containing protein [Desulfobulbus sp. N3]